MERKPLLLRSLDEVVDEEDGGALRTRRFEEEDDPWLQGSEQSRGALPKNLIRPLPYRIPKASGSGDLLSRSPVHAGGRDGVDYSGGASREVAKP